MECRSCTDALTALMDQELPPAEQQSVEEHLSTCASCRNEYESLLEAHRLPVQLSAISPDVGLWRRIEAELAGGSALGVRPVVRSSYSASRMFHTTGLPLEERRWRGCAGRPWHSTGAKRCYEIVVFFR